MNNMDSPKQIAKRVLNLEANAVLALIDQLDEQFEQVCHLILKNTGRIIVTGVGKSGHIAGKIAASLASTGTPAFFVHPSEASHGDLGMVMPHDVVLALSNSGETPEILSITPILKRMGVSLIAMTGKPSSTLATIADYHLDVSVKAEACPLNLAPTSSTTAALAMGDALTVALLEMRGFTKEDFARSHPGGALGKRLLLYVQDIMHTKPMLPCVKSSVTIHQALLEMTDKGLGMTCIIDDHEKIMGVYTDGDLRRSLNNKHDIYTTMIDAVMTPQPVTIKANILAAQAVALMQQRKINGVFVTNDDNQVIGALNITDLIRAGIF